MKPKNRFGRWFRVYDEALDDPKIQQLGDKLGFFWFNCMCLASKNGGILPPIDEIVWKLRKPKGQITAMLATLNERGLLDPAAGSFAPHNWDERQFCSDVSTERVRRFRQQKKVSGNGDETDMKRDETFPETPPDTQTETDTDTQTETDTYTEGPRGPMRVSQPRAADLSGPTSMRFEEFWAEYPRKMYRDRAAAQWVSLVTADIEEHVFECLREYLASSEVARGVLTNPDKWLHEQHRNGWAGGWPRAPTSPSQIAKTSRTKEIIDSL